MLNTLEIGIGTTLNTDKGVYSMEENIVKL